MKLLFDENLSHKLTRLLKDLFPGSIHVRDVGLKSADDPLLWEYAKNNDLIIVSKDADMHQQFSVWTSAQNRLGASGQLLNFRS